jgi:plastocyanin
MKGTLVALITVLSGLCLIFYPELSFARQSQSQGKVEGVVLLAPKKNPVSVGGRYGRPSSSSASSRTSTDSVLIWLESSDLSSGAAPESPVVLDQKDLSFKPSLLPVRQHGDVRIRNSDPVYHNVFSLSSIKRFDVGRRPKGEYLDVTFDKPGAVDVFCDIHSNMRATIYVMPPSVVRWTKVKSGDAFSIPNIAKGTYELKIYALGYQEQAISVEVSSGEPSDVGTLTLNF